jgi:hypothetical protein
MSSSSPLPIRAYATPHFLTARLAARRDVCEQVLVQRERRGRQQACRVHPEALGSAADWIKRTAGIWSGRLSALGDYLATDHESKEDR